MDRSSEVVDALLRFYDRLTAGDVASFDDLISSSEHTSILGTAPGEFVTERERLRFGFETEGIGLEAGPNPIGFSEGSVGFAIDEPFFKFPDGSGMRIRLTSIWRHEDGVWKLIHGHYSVAVPDEEVQELQARWGIS